MSQTKHEITSSTAGRRRNVFLGIIYETTMSQIIVLKKQLQFCLNLFCWDEDISLRQLWELLTWKRPAEFPSNSCFPMNFFYLLLFWTWHFRSEDSVVPANDASQQAVQAFKEMVFLFFPGFLNKLVHLWGDAQTLLVVQAHPDWTTPPRCFFSWFIGHRWSFSSLLES